MPVVEPTLCNETNILFAVELKEREKEVSTLNKDFKCQLVQNNESNCDQIKQIVNNEQCPSINNMNKCEDTSQSGLYKIKSSMVTENNKPNLDNSYNNKTNESNGDTNISDTKDLDGIKNAHLIEKTEVAVKEINVDSEKLHTLNNKETSKQCDSREKIYNTKENESSAVKDNKDLTHVLTAQTNVSHFTDIQNVDKNTQLKTSSTLELVNTLLISDDEVELVDDDNSVTKIIKKNRDKGVKDDDVMLIEDDSSESKNVRQRVLNNNTREARKASSLSNGVKKTLGTLSDTDKKKTTDILKKKFTAMSRNEFEEFCLFKTVESLNDISEIKACLKKAVQENRKWREKAMLLTKQFKDIQITLKLVQEEHKKRTNGKFQPLRVVRSVGMQVYVDGSRSTVFPETPQQDLNRNISRTNISSVPKNKTISRSENAQPVAQITTSSSPALSPLTPPKEVYKNMSRLNLSSEPKNKTTSHSEQLGAQVTTSSVSNSGKPGASNMSPAISNRVNSIEKSTANEKPNPIVVQEKRSFTNVQSETVDLTYDEPPPKVVVIQSAPPHKIRLIPQHLLQTSAPVAPDSSTSQKVPVPESGRQNVAKSIIPGQSLLLKTPQSSTDIRPKGPKKQKNQKNSIKLSPPKEPVRLAPKQSLMSRHPAPLPPTPPQLQASTWKALPPAPDLKIAKSECGIVVSWKIDDYFEDSYESIASYQLYAYQETSLPPSTALWKKIGDVKALPLPMACTLTQFVPGYKYYFAVRSVDMRSRLGPFSLPSSILLLNK